MYLCFLDPVIPLLKLFTEEIIREAVKGCVSMYRIIKYRSIVCNSKKFQVVAVVKSFCYGIFVLCSYLKSCAKESLLM